MQNRFLLTLGALALLAAGCSKTVTEEIPRHNSAASYDDADYLLDGLVKNVDGALIPMYGILREDGVLQIPATSVFESERHFRSLLTRDAAIREEGSTITWTLTDGQGRPQGKAVFSLGGESPLTLGTIAFPEDFPLTGAEYLSAQSFSLLDAVNPDVQEDLEDNYFYGAIVDIPDYGCGSGKFVVFREYNFETGENGMALRVDGHRWNTSEYTSGDNAHQISARASCLSTMQTAGAIYRADRNILSKQLRNAGCTAIDQHYYTDSRSWTGRNYYYCLHDGECDTIGPFTDTEFYECWIYWFHPDGDHIRFW